MALPTPDRQNESMQISSEQLVQLGTIGWCAETPLPTDVVGNLVRVIAQHRNGYRVHNGHEEFSAQPAPRFLKRDADPQMRPTVGDFVLLAATGAPLIETVLPRRSLLTRGAAGERYQRQSIAANVDSVIVLMGLDGDFNPRRIERYLLLIEGSGAAPVIVLSKRDLLSVEDCAAAIAAVHEVVPQQTSVYAINTKDSTSVALLLPFLGPGASVVLVGSSGAGKSTLTNTLLGQQRQATGVVREHDSRGRHTTTYRALIQLPSGGCLIDTPGMRELKLTGEENLAAASFADIEILAQSCRFNDCVHAAEPGCALVAALAAGKLDPARWDSYLKLRNELDAATDSLEAQLKRKAEGRVAGKALNKRLAEKYGHR